MQLQLQATPRYRLPKNEREQQAQSVGDGATTQELPAMTSTRNLVLQTVDQIVVRSSGWRTD